MDITLLPPSSILSKHSHLALLTSPFPNVSLRSSMPSPRPSYKHSWKRHCPAAPPSGSSPISTLPDDILLGVFSHLPWEAILASRTVCQRWHVLAASPSLYTDLTLHGLPPCPLPASALLLMTSVRRLRLHLFPYPAAFRAASSFASTTSALVAMLQCIPPDQLLELSIPFSSPYLPMDELGSVLKDIGGKLEVLDLKGSGLNGSRWIEWVRHVGCSGSGLRKLDLSFTSISALPGGSAASSGPSMVDVTASSPKDPFRALEVLSLGSCSYLPEAALTGLLLHLPPTLKRLDLSRLETVTFSALWDLRVVHRKSEDDIDVPTALEQVKVVGIDHLTRRDIRRLKSHWEDQRRTCNTATEAEEHPWFAEPISVRPIKWKAPLTPPMRHGLLSPPTSPGSSVPLATEIQPRSLPTPPASVSPLHDGDEKAGRGNSSIEIIHSAILESEDEAGYRQFIGEVVNGTVLGGEGGLALGWDLGTRRTAGAWVEIEGDLM